MTSKPLLSTPPETDQRRIVPGWLAQLTGMPSSQCVLAIGPSVRPDAMADEELSGRMIKEPLGTFGLALLEVITDWRVTRADGVYALKVIRETLKRMRQRSEVTFVRADYYGQYISGEVQLGTTGAVGVAEAQLDPALVAGKNTLSTLRGVEPPPNKWVWVKDLDAELALTAKNAPGLTVHYELILDRPERVFDATGQLRTEDNYAWHTLSAVNDDFGNMDIRLVLGDRKVRRLAYNINEATTLADREGIGAIVLSDHGTCRHVDDVAGGLTEPRPQEARRVTVRDEADVVAVGLARHRGVQANRAAHRVGRVGKDLRKAGVDPVDHRRVRAVVEREAASRRPQRAHAVRLHAQEQAHIGLAEPVNGLHRVADQKQGAAVAVLPAGGQPLEQAHLGRAGVLEFVDQQVADAVVQLQLQIAGRVVIAQGQQGVLRHLREVDLAALVDLLEDSDVVLANDSGPRHVAMAVGTSAISGIQKSQW